MPILPVCVTYVTVHQKGTINGLREYGITPMPANLSPPGVLVTPSEYARFCVTSEILARLVDVAARHFTPAEIAYVLGVAPARVIKFEARACSSCGFDGEPPNDNCADCRGTGGVLYPAAAVADFVPLCTACAEREARRPPDALPLKCDPAHWA